MFKKIREDCAICSEGFSVQIESTSMGEFHVKYAERATTFLADADGANFGDSDGLLVHINTLRRLDDPYPGALVQRDKIMSNIDRALEFLQIHHQFS